MTGFPSLPRTVCILAAGRGTRLDYAGGRLHKALAPIGNRAVLTHIIQSLGADSQFIIAVGHLEEQIRAYVELAHPDLSVSFVVVPDYNGPASGPGLSLLQCRPLLSGPFLLTAADSIVVKPPRETDTSWLAVAAVANPADYLTVETDARGRVVDLHERTGKTTSAFVGLASVTDPDAFFAGLEAPGAPGEHQVTPGLMALIGANGFVAAHEVDWLDTGTISGYEAARVRFDEEPSGGRIPLDVTYLVGERVVKWASDPEAVRDRTARARLLKGMVPALLPAPESWMAYDLVPGETLRDSVDGLSATDFLDWAADVLWQPVAEPPSFRAACADFYGRKTSSRLAAYAEDSCGGIGESDAVVINGLVTDRVAHALAVELDGLVAASTPCLFHGDLHEGNIIVTTDRYRLIDWRGDFGGIRDAGDRQYDLAKFLHTLELPESVMAAGTFSAVASGGAITLAQPDTTTRQAARRAFWTWCDRQAIDTRALGILDALVFINMAPLYQGEMSRYLYALGRWLLQVSRDASSWQERESILGGGLLR